jgi:stage III sporulation protein AF
MDVDLKSFQFSDNNYLLKKNIEENSKVLNDKQMKKIAEVYRENIISQLEEGMKGVKGISSIKADVIINEDYKSKTFGEVKRVYLSITPEEDKNIIKPVKKVEKVDIGSDKKLLEENEKINSDTRRQIEERVIKFLDINKENIVITLQEG